MSSAGIGAVARVVRATVISIQGLRAAIRTEPPFRLELLVLVLIVPAAWTLTKVGVERALLIGSWLLVMIVELINSAIETIVDRIGSERHDLSGRAKDLGSAAVFGAIVLAVLVWLFVLFSV